MSARFGAFCGVQVDKSNDRYLEAATQIHPGNARRVPEGDTV
jgi:hypothetical protein